MAGVERAARGHDHARPTGKADLPSTNRARPQRGAKLQFYSGTTHLHACHAVEEGRLHDLPETAAAVTPGTAARTLARNAWVSRRSKLALAGGLQVEAEALGARGQGWPPSLSSPQAA